MEPIRSIIPPQIPGAWPGRRAGKMSCAGRLGVTLFQEAGDEDRHQGRALRNAQPRRGRTASARTWALTPQTASVHLFRDSSHRMTQRGYDQKFAGTALARIEGRRGRLPRKATGELRAARSMRRTGSRALSGRRLRRHPQQPADGLLPPASRADAASTRRGRYARGTVEFHANGTDAGDRCLRASPPVTGRGLGEGALTHSVARGRDPFRHSPPKGERRGTDMPCVRLRQIPGPHEDGSNA